MHDFTHVHRVPKWKAAREMATINWTALRKQTLGGAESELLPPQIKLPMLPHAVMEFAKRAENPEVGSRELAKIIETDTGLTCELLRYVNSCLFGLRRKAANAQQAIGLLGSRQCKLFLLTTGVKSALSTRESKLINFRTFWMANLERALFAREVAGLLKVDTDLAFAAAMLQDSLLPVVSTELYSVYVQYGDLPEKTARDLPVYEKEQLGWTHAFSAAAIMAGWQFPDDLVCCVLFHHAGLRLLADNRIGRSAASAVAVASLLPDPFRQVRRGLADLLQLEAAWPAFQLLELAGRVDEQFQALSGQVNEFSLRHRCERQLESMAVAG